MSNFAPYFIDMWLPTNKIPGVIIILFLATGLLSIRCGKEETPKDILPQDQLTSIMIEFYLAEARLTNISVPLDSASKLFLPFEESTLKKYGVPDSTLKRTYQYYFDHPIELEKLYEVVIDSLSLRERKTANGQQQVK